jgi:hypothetical protein
VKSTSGLWTKPHTRTVGTTSIFPRLFPNQKINFLAATQAEAIISQPSNCDFIVGLNARPPFVMMNSRQASAQLVAAESALGRTAEQQQQQQACSGDKLLM